MNLRSLALGAGAALLLTGCSVIPAAPPSPSEPSGSTAAPHGQSANPLPTGSQPVTLDPADFTVEIDHPYWPMKPGTRWTYREDEGGEVKEVVVVVTDQTKKIANGVTARVVRDTVRVDGEIIEDTFDWYAQDRQGQPVVPRGGHRRVRGRQGQHPLRLVRGRPGRRAAGHHAARRSRPGHAVPPGVLRRPGGGQR